MGSTFAPQLLSRRRAAWLVLASKLTLLLVILMPPVRAQSVGDEWTGRRGDNNPSLTYDVMTTTSTGRMIAVGDGGHLMISDNGGSHWEFSRIARTPGQSIGTVSDILEFSVGGSGSKRLVAIAAEFVAGGPLGYKGRTLLHISNDDGNSWSTAPFPHDNVPFGPGQYEGVTLTGLHVSPAGELLAYGTTMVTSNRILIWSIGGLIFRSPDGVNWTLARFAYGPLNHMADADGRVVAVGATTVLDSADGAGWNGYFLRDGVIMDGGSPMPLAQSNRIRLHDVAINSGTYTAYGVIHVPVSEIVDSALIARQFTLISSSPFGPGRQWQLHDQATYPGRFLKAPGAFLGLGLGGVRSSANNGVSWSSVNANPRPTYKSFTRSGSNITVVNSSQAAWRSTDSGSTWNKVWDDPVGPALSVIGVHFGLVFARSGNDLYVSSDNGLTWELRGSVSSLATLTKIGSRLVVAGGSAQTVRVSDDQGVTWQNKTVASTSASNSVVVTTPTGRLVMGAQGRNISGPGVFYVSDDQGETWQPRTAGLPWGEDIGQLFCTAAGTLIATSNSFATFNPRLIRSEDNGETWTMDFSLRSVAGLDEVSGDPATKVFTCRMIRQNPVTGRLLMLGDEDEILTSDDEGKTWTVRLNFDTPFVAPWRDWQLEGLVWSAGRWVTLFNLNNDASGKEFYTLVSADDGVTWRKTRLPLNQANTYLQYLAVGLDGRVIASGSNGAVYTTDPPAPPPPVSEGETVREGNVLALTVSRPPFPGNVTASYRSVNGSAQGGTDFVVTQGELSWDEGDANDRTVQVPTIDNNVKQAAARQFSMQIEYAAEELAASTEIPVSILDDDGGATAGILAEGGPLETSEDGGGAELLVALNRLPAQPVVINLGGLNPAEGRLSVTTLTFTPENWNRQQTVVVTGIDDWLHDGDHAHVLNLVASSGDAAYEGLRVEVPVVNQDNDPPEAGRALRVGQQLNLGLGHFGNVIAVKGLPRGLRWDKINQTLVGRVTTARRYTITFTLQGEGGARTQLAVTLVIEPLPEHAVGSFSGWIDRDPDLNGDLGGALSLKVTKSAAQSGVLRLAGRRHSWRGALKVPGLGQPMVEQIINRGGLPPVELALEMQAGQRLAGSVEAGAGEAGVTGWRHIWSKRSQVQAAWQGQFNALFWPGVPWENDLTVPLGTGQTQLRVTETGAARWIGRYADATSLTGSFHLGPQGDVRHWQALYKNTGSARFAAMLNAPDNLDGSGDWLRLPPLKPTRSYSAGFGLDLRGPLALTLTGGRWTKPGKGENLLAVLSLDEVSSNLDFKFDHGGIASSATPPDTSATLDARNRVVTEKQGPANEAGVTGSFTASTGVVSGVMRPRDDDPEKPGRALVRTTKFLGLWVPRLNRAEGSFQLPQLADPGVTTKNTSPILSGQMKLVPADPGPP